MAQSVQPGNDGSVPGRDKNFFHSVEIGSGTPPSVALEVKRSGREAVHSPTCNGEVKKAWTYASVPPYTFTKRY